MRGALDPGEGRRVLFVGGRVRFGCVEERLAEVFERGSLLFEGANLVPKLLNLVLVRVVRDRELLAGVFDLGSEAAHFLLEGRVLGLEGRCTLECAIELELENADLLRLRPG
jgi:hypothetical protein